MKTALKPSTKATPLVITGTRVSRSAIAEPPAVASAGRPACPLRYAAYAGISGNTHGDRNDTRPARNAIGYEGAAASASIPTIVKKPCRRAGYGGPST